MFDSKSAAAVARHVISSAEENEKQTIKQCLIDTHGTQSNHSILPESIQAEISDDLAFPAIVPSMDTA